MDSIKPAGDSFDDQALAALIARAADGVVVVDGQGLIRYWNAGAERIFGYSNPDVLGTSLDQIIPERLRERHWAGFTQALSTGTSRYGANDLLAVPAVTADGRTISIEFTVVLTGSDGLTKYVGAVIRDVTERRAKEVELRRRLAALEATAAPDADPRPRAK
jgi:PAS domain S-box-containing protein